MGDVEHFALLVLVVGAAITAAVVFNRVSERIRIPAPAIFLVAAAVASDVVPALGELSVTTVQREHCECLAWPGWDARSGWSRQRRVTLENTGRHGACLALDPSPELPAPT